MTIRRGVATAALTVLCLVASGLIAAQPAVGKVAGCLPDVGKKVPVLFVHGFLGKPEQWGNVSDPRSMIGTVAIIPTVAAGAFSYAEYATQWVTNPNIGKALAERIICMAASSREQGGAGKVVVVAHSMGGLATRQAIAESPEAAKALGLVITIGTPNTGSHADRALIDLTRSFCDLLFCGPPLYSSLNALSAIPALASGSPEIKALPWWPKGLPVYAIAGNITPHYNLFGLQFDGPPSNSDTLVGTDSALLGPRVGNLGGTRQFACKADAPILPAITQADCEHGALVSNPGVQAQVVAAIKAYAAEQAKPQRKLPEGCDDTAFYQGNGYTLHGYVTILSGTVTCGAAVKLAQDYLEKTRPGSATVIGQWTCRSASADGRGAVSECTGPEGKVRIVTE